MAQIRRTRMLESLVAALPRASTLAVAVTLAACAAQPPRSQDPSVVSLATGSGLQRAAVALRAGNTMAARTALAAELRADPRNGYLHLLNGLSYVFDAASPQSLDLAGVGFDAAVRLAPGFYWAHYHAGALALQRQQYDVAAEQFAQAILSDPDQPRAFLGLAVAAYSAGDLPVAVRAANRALALASTDPLVLRTAAFVAAGAGDRGALDDVIGRARLVPAAWKEIDAQQGRLAQLVRVATLGQEQASSAGEATPVTHQDLTQIMVEVTLLVSQNSRTKRTGINLLDGLNLQFSGQESYVRNDSSPGGSASAQLMTTYALSVPQITYSLNLFNTKDDFYDVLVRPSLVASIGETSEFFIGRTVTIGVSGVNMGSLQPVDAGTSVRVTPMEITPQKAKFRVEAVRSFFGQEQGGTFEQSLTTFKQSVSATVDVEFGKTLILSGLYEAVNMGGSSKTPGLGDVPGVNLAFNSRNIMVHQDAALVLVTPRIPGTIDTGTREFGGETLRHVLDLWTTFVLPTGGLDATITTIQAKKKYFRPLVGDVRLTSPRDPQLLAATIADTTARLR
jgi:Tfp pilus assembly protein PilF